MNAKAMTESMLKSLWSYRRTFFATALGIFAILTVLIFLIAKDFAIRSSIEIGATLINDKLESLEPPEQVAKQINSSYVIAALLAAAQRGARLTCRRRQEPERFGELELIPEVPRHLRRGAPGLAVERPDG